jgi:parvulin-like peptidyl-prolyl isomerase
MLLSQAFTRRIQEEKTNISDDEVASEYKNHPELFEKATLLRIFIPKQKHHTSGVEMLREAAADEVAMKAEAEQIRKKALAGANFAKLEKEVYAYAGESPDEAPEVALGDTTRSSMERQYQDVVFNLKPGQISELVPAPKGWHIFKVVSKGEVPMSEAKNILLSLRVREAIDAAKAELKTDFNDAYFNVPGGMERMKPGGTNANSSANQSK